MPGSLGHLSGRFFDVLLARPLDEAEQATVGLWLTPELSEVFFSQSPADQRHGYEAGLIVMGGGGSPDMVTAAVMHDTAKRHAGLGVLGRVVASILIRAGLPLTPRMRLYRDHGIIAAKELAELGAPPLAVDFALHHHRSRPASIPEETWKLLEKADRAKAANLGSSGISFGAT